MNPLPKSTGALCMVLAAALALAAMPAQAAQRTAPAAAAEEVPPLSDEACGPLYVPTHVGPWDYRNDRHMLSIVEFGHYQPKVEALIAPMFQYFGADLAYTLKAFPNHHRALVTMVRLGQREKSLQPKAMQYSIECFFYRGIKFRPDDLIVRMIYAGWLHQQSRQKDAVVQLDYVVENAADDPFTHYNAGMVFADMQMWDRALQQAHKAQALGFERQELKSRLVSANKWQEPPPESTGSVSGGASAPAAAPVPAPAAAASAAPAS